MYVVFSGFTQTKILDFFRIQKCNHVLVKCISPQGNLLFLYNNDHDQHCYCYYFRKLLFLQGKNVISMMSLKIGAHLLFMSFAKISIPIVKILIPFYYVCYYFTKLVYI